MDKPAQVPDLVLADDLLEGAADFSEFLGFSQRRTIYLLEKGDIPAGKLRGRWIGSKSQLREFFAELAGEAKQERAAAQS